MRVPLPYILSGIVLLSGLGGRAARAGDYHRGTDLVCSDCHVIHYDMQHGYTGGPPAAQGAAGPYPKLLRNTATELCLSCHDGQVGSGDVAPDVIQGAGPGQPAARAAGAFQELPGTETPNGHSLLVSATPPGGTTAMALDCLSCHDAHGNGYYRNLVPDPGGVSGLGVTAVTQTQTTPTTEHYSTANVHYTASDGGLSAWCGGCHGDFHGAAGSPDTGGSPVGDTNLSSVSPWLRHPTRDVTMGQAVTNQHVDASYWFSALESRVPVVSTSDAVPGSGSGSDNQVFCGTCHKVHGSPHRYGLIWDNPTTAVPEDGSSVMDSCEQCHHK